MLCEDIFCHFIKDSESVSGVETPLLDVSMKLRSAVPVEVICRNAKTFDIPIKSTVAREKSLFCDGWLCDLRIDVSLLINTFPVKTA